MAAVQQYGDGKGGSGLAVCGDALRVSYLLPPGATYVPLQVHDGALQGNRCVCAHDFTLC